MQDPLPLRRSVTIFGYRRFMLRTSCGVQCAGFALVVWAGCAGRPVELFALLLLSAVVARFLWGARHLARVPGLAAGFGRRTARGVYLLMYVLVGIELLGALSASRPPHTERCLPYLGCVVAAQLLIRAMTAAMCAPGKDGGTAGAAVESADNL